MQNNNFYAMPEVVPFQATMLFRPATSNFGLVVTGAGLLSNIGEQEEFKAPELADVLEFRVTRKDLRANYGDIHNCPIAAALKREIGYNDVSVSPDGATVWNGCYDLARYRMKMSADLNANIRSMCPPLRWILGGFNVKLTKIK